MPACAVIAGQSNAVGMGDPDSLSTAMAADYDGVRYAYTMACPADDGAGACAQVKSWGNLTVDLSTHGCEVSLGRELGGGKDVLKFATSSTSLAAAWDPYAATGYVLYNRLLSAVDNLSADVQAFAWIHGEEDAKTAENSGAYETNLREFIGCLREDLDLNLRVCVVPLRSDCSRAFAAQVRAAQIAAVASDRDSILVYADDIDGFDGLHYDSSGLVELGELLGRAMSTTTFETLRDRQITLIQALTPNSQSCDVFRVSREEPGRFEEWAEAHPAACMRRFIVRDIGERPLPDVSNCDYEWIEGTEEIVVAYPQGMRYGVNNRRDLFDLMRSDFAQIDNAIGHRGTGNYIAGHAVRQEDNPAFVEADGVTFLVARFTYRFWEAV